mgnify:CR=1 FL=1
MLKVIEVKKTRKTVNKSKKMLFKRGIKIIKNSIEGEKMRANLFLRPPKNSGYIFQEKWKYLRLSVNLTASDRQSEPLKQSDRATERQRDIET